MANWKGHVIGGVVLGAAYAGALSYAPVERLAEEAQLLHDWQALLGVMVLSVLFALFPDIDTNSKGQNIFYGIALAFDVLLIWNGNMQAAAYLGLIAMLPVVSKHRGWTHSKLAMLLVPLPIVVVPYMYDHKVLGITTLYYGAAVVGYFSHLLLDGLIIKWFRVKTRAFAE
ncbi:MAG TPA: metal-dependent hydrolase [Candidatus Saccharimonadales bacterium]